MDYRYYQGNPLIKIPDKYWKYVHWLCYVGAGLCLLSIVIPLLMILKLIELTFFLNFLSFIFNFYGVVIWVYGHSLTKARKNIENDGEEFMNTFYEKKRSRSRTGSP